MREFKVIDAAVSTDQLRMRLRDNELEQYGESFVPDFVYDVIRRLSRFSSMRVSLSIDLVMYVLISNSVDINKMQKSSLGSSWKSFMMSVVVQ